MQGKHTQNQTKFFRTWGMGVGSSLSKRRWPVAVTCLRSSPKLGIIIETFPSNAMKKVNLYKRLHVLASDENRETPKYLFVQILVHSSASCFIFRFPFRWRYFGPVVYANWTDQHGKRRIFQRFALPLLTSSNCYFQEMYLFDKGFQWAAQHGANC